MQTKGRGSEPSGRPKRAGRGEGRHREERGSAARGLRGPRVTESGGSHPALCRTTQKPHHMGWQSLRAASPFNISPGIFLLHIPSPYPFEYIPFSIFPSTPHLADLRLPSHSLLRLSISNGARHGKAAWPDTNGAHRLACTAQRSSTHTAQSTHCSHLAAAGREVAGGGKGGCRGCPTAAAAAPIRST